MKIINDIGVSQAWIKAAELDMKIRTGWRSATELIDTPRAVCLKRRHFDEIVRPISGMIWALMGKAMHALLAEANGHAALAEEELIIVRSGRKISMTPDWVEDAPSKGRYILRDFKTTKVWAVCYGIKPEWVAQDNVYAQGLEEWGYPVELAFNEVMIRDRDNRESIIRAARGDSTYPQHDIVVIPIPLWPETKRLAYIDSRIIAHAEAEALPDDRLPHCTPEERWAKPDRWAIVHQKSKRAVNGCANILVEQDARDQYARMLAQGKEVELQFRPGESIRCADYCDAAPFCNQWAAIKKTQVNDE